MAAVMRTAVILICTCNRPHYLNELLLALVHEVRMAPCKTLSTVVVDNGSQEVQDLVESFGSDLPIEYVRLPQSDLVAARNCSLRHGLRHKPDYLVFIDDDEVPESSWLSGLLSTIAVSGADFAVGPVNPKFSSPPPSWAPEFFTKTGETFCTSNLIIRSSVVPCDEELWFKPRFSSSGGEDGDFLRRLAASGAKHTVAPSALVLENIPLDRVSARYLWRRGFRDGIVAAQISSGGAGEGALDLTRNILRALRKTGYGLNHLFWSISRPNRIYRAIDDLSFASGLILGSFGASSKFYGP
jgi:succinoglycan biosynthesis protein ExoM